MKKIKTIVLSIVAVLLLPFVFAACGEDEPIVLNGEYTVKSAEASFEAKTTTLLAIMGVPDTGLGGVGMPEFLPITVHIDFKAEEAQIDIAGMVIPYNLEAYPLAVLTGLKLEFIAESYNSGSLVLSNGAASLETADYSVSDGGEFIFNIDETSADTVDIGGISAKLRYDKAADSVTAEAVVNLGDLFSYFQLDPGDLPEVPEIPELPEIPGLPVISPEMILEIISSLIESDTDAVLTAVFLK